VCVLHWKQAYNAGYAPMVHLECTDQNSLKYVELSQLIELSVEKHQTIE
jgi:uncharacterized protein (DUF2237 family)